MLQAYAQAVDFKVGHHFGEGQRLNGQLVSHLAKNQGRPLKGHIGLQNHHPGSRVQFRNVFVNKIGAAAAAGGGG
jgi:hypothetical protein